jgi:hypothetical protein
MKSITNLSKFSLIGHVSKTDCENDKFCETCIYCFKSSIYCFKSSLHLKNTVSTINLLNYFILFICSCQNYKSYDFVILEDLFKDSLGPYF